MTRCFSFLGIEGEVMDVLYFGCWSTPPFPLDLSLLINKDDRRKCLGTLPLPSP